MTSQLKNVTDRLNQKAIERPSIAAAMATGLFAGSMMVILTVTYAALIFSGDLSQFIAQGIALSITSIIIVGLMLSLFSSSPHFIAQLDDDTAPIFALLLSFLAASLPVGLGPDELMLNVMAAIFVSTILAGLVLTVFGLFNFGSFVQFLPYSVMGGYFAAVGWLLLVGVLGMLTKIEFSSLDSVFSLFSNDMLTRWVPAVVVGVWLRYMSRRIAKGMLLAGTVSLFTAAFYFSAWLLDLGPADLMSNDYLMGPFSEEPQQLLNPVSQISWYEVDWGALLSNLGSIASISLISLLSIILCISAISLSTRRDLEPNKELRISGLANIINGLLGGILTLPSVSISKLAFELHPSANRIIGLTSVAFAVLTFYFGMNILAHLPKMVLGSLLVYIGLGFVTEWLIAGYRKFGALEYSVIPIILVVSVFVGFLQSILVGVVAAIILFVIKYSRIRVVRYEASGTDLRSNLVRDIEQNLVLKEHGHQVRMFKLQGYLFFGTAGSLYQRVMNFVEAPENESLKYVILDFSQVIGVDSSATLNFEKLTQRLSERKIYLITTSLKKDVLEILRRGGLDLDGNSFLIQHADLDQGMEWCENYILKQQSTQEMERRGIFERMSDALPQSDRLHTLGKYLRKVEVNEGDVLTRMGEQSTEVFFLESCTASAYIIDSHNIERRVSGAGRGAIYGEIGFFLNIPRTALVKADSDGELFSLSTDSLAEMKKEEPELASAITHYLAQVVTERLVNTTQSLRAVL
jgi:SulP family sulfate permease